MKVVIKIKKTEIAVSPEKSDQFFLIVLDEYSNGLFHLIFSEDGTVKDELKISSKNKAYTKFHELQQMYLGTIQNQLTLE